MSGNVLRAVGNEPCEPGDDVVAVCLLGEENHCLRCGALVFTAAERILRALGRERKQPLHPDACEAEQLSDTSSS